MRGLEAISPVNYFRLHQPRQQGSMHFVSPQYGCYNESFFKQLRNFNFVGIGIFAVIQY
jgi:hypothetical protein